MRGLYKAVRCGGSLSLSAAHRKKLALKTENYPHGAAVLQLATLPVCSYMHLNRILTSSENLKPVLNGNTDRTYGERCGLTAFQAFAFSPSLKKKEKKRCDTGC